MYILCENLRASMHAHARVCIHTHLQHVYTQIVIYTHAFVCTISAQMHTKYQCVHADLSHSGLSLYARTAVLGVHARPDIQYVHTHFSSSWSVTFDQNHCACASFVYTHTHIHTHGACARITSSSGILLISHQLYVCMYVYTYIHVYTHTNTHRM